VIKGMTWDEVIAKLNFPEVSEEERRKIAARPIRSFHIEAKCPNCGKRLGWDSTSNATIEEVAASGPVCYYCFAEVPITLENVKEVKG